MTDKILLYADGASKGNPGPAGWGALIVLPSGQVQELGAGVSTATNNQMELQAVISGLNEIAILPGRGEVIVLTDSSYVIRGVTEWLARWQRNHWQTSLGERVRNQELWQELAAQVARVRRQGLRINWQHVRGHAGIPGNERVDRIAHHFALGEQVRLYEGPLASYGFDPHQWEAPAREAAVAKKSRSKGQAYSYLSLLDGVLAIHKTWAECEARVKGQKGARFKKALNREDEQAIISQWKHQP